MVCFAQFQYKVNYEDLSRFILNAKTYFPNIEWEITLDDLTIRNRDIDSAVKRLNPNPGDIVLFDTGRIWEGLSFVNVIPEIKFQPYSVSDTFREKYVELATTIAKRYHDSGEETLSFCPIDFPWDSTLEMLAYVNEILPLHGYIISHSTRTIWLKKRGTNRLMGIVQRDGRDNYTNCCPRIVFDIDDGFLACGDEYDVPIELQRMFQKWVDGGRVGPVWQST